MTALSALPTSLPAATYKLSGFNQGPMGDATVAAFSWAIGTYRYQNHIHIYIKYPYQRIHIRGGIMEFLPRMLLITMQSSWKANTCIPPETNYLVGLTPWSLGPDTLG